jgi:hypothetical protein
VANSLSHKSDEIIKEIRSLIWNLQIEKYTSGLTPRKNHPVLFKELTLDKSQVDEIVEHTRKLLDDPISGILYRKHKRFFLLLSALFLVRFRPRSGGFWDHIYRVFDTDSFSYRTYFDAMWESFQELSAESLFFPPIERTKRLLVQTIYRESKSISFNEIREFFLRYYASYDDMRAFDSVYEQYEFEEKEENRYVIRDTVEKLVAMFNFLGDLGTIDQAAAVDQLKRKIKDAISIDPLSLFGSNADLEELIQKVFHKNVTLSWFERMLRSQQPKVIRMHSTSVEDVSWAQLLDRGIAFTKYQVGNQTVVVVPRLGISIEDMVRWPENIFIDPGSPNTYPGAIKSDIVAIKRRDPFEVQIGDWGISEEASALYWGGKNFGYAWVGKRQIGQSLVADNLTCLAKTGCHLSAALKLSQKGKGLCVFLSYLDFYSPDVNFSKLEVRIGNQRIWRGITDGDGRKLTEIYEKFEIPPDFKSDRLELQVIAGTRPIGEPIVITLDTHMLFSNHTNFPVHPGKRKTGERHYTLFSRAEIADIVVLPSVKLEEVETGYCGYKIYSITWVKPQDPFQLKIDDYEWYFSEPEEVFIQSEFVYRDATFSVTGELIPFATTDPHEAKFAAHANLRQERLDLFDVVLTFDGITVGRKSLREFFKLCEGQWGQTRRFGEPQLRALQDGTPLEIGKYTIWIERGKLGGRDTYRNSIDLFILPTLTLVETKAVFKEKDDLKVIIRSSQLCFSGDKSPGLHDEMELKLGVAHLETQGYRHNVILERPRVSLSFEYIPVIFGCRLEQSEIGSEIYLDSLEGKTLYVYGSANGQMALQIGSEKKKYVSDTTGQLKLHKSNFERLISTTKSQVCIEHCGQALNFTIIWRPTITKLSHSSKDGREAAVYLDEAAFYLEVDGPPDTTIQLRLLNNLGELCGETVVNGVGAFEGSVTWNFPGTKTRTLVLKAFILNSEGVYVDSGTKEVRYEFIDPALELEHYLQKVKKDPSDSLSAYKAALIAHENSLLDPEKIKSLILQSFHNGLSDVRRLEKAASLLDHLGSPAEAREVLRRAIKSFGSSPETYADFLSYALKQPFWSEGQSLIFRYALEEGKNRGLGSAEVSFFSACRVTRDGALEDARQFLYETKDPPAEMMDKFKRLEGVIHFKKGHFGSIQGDLKGLTKRDPIDLMLTKWAQFVLGERLHDDLKTFSDGGSLYWCLLADGEKECLKSISNLNGRTPEEVLISLEAHRHSIPVKLTIFRLFLLVGRTDDAEKTYRELCGLSTYFERNLSTLLTRRKSNE